MLFEYEFLVEFDGGQGGFPPSGDSGERRGSENRDGNRSDRPQLPPSEDEGRSNNENRPEFPPSGGWSNDENRPELPSSNREGNNSN